MLGNLNALFSNVGGFKDDAMAYGTMAAGALAAPIAYNYLFEMVAQAAKLDAAGPAVKYGKPAGALILGIVGGNMVARKFNRNLGMGIAVGATASAISGLVAAVSPDTYAMLTGVKTAAPAATLPAADAKVAGYLGRGMGLVAVEEVNGAPISIENVQGFAGNVASSLY